MRESILLQPDYTQARGRRNALGALFSLALLIVAANPLSLVAQQQAPTVDRPELMVFARAHIAMNEARDEFHAEMGSTHEEQARARAPLSMRKWCRSFLSMGWPGTTTNG